MMLVELKASIRPYENEQYNAIRVLWAQVLKQAIFDFVKLKNSSDLKDRRDFRTARSWIFSNEVGLVDTCSVMGWPLEALRRRALAMTRNDIKKMEFRDRDVVREIVAVGDTGHGNSK